MGKPENYTVLLQILTFIELPVSFYGAYCILFKTPPKRSSIETMTKIVWMLFLLLLVSGIASTDAESIIDKNNLIMSLNGARRKFADDHFIANMWMMNWSEDLVAKAQNLTSECDKLVTGPDYRYLFASEVFLSVKRNRRAVESHDLGSDGTKWSRVNKEKTESEISIAQILDVIIAFPGIYLEALLPIQTHIGCVLHKCVDDQPFLCLVGPHGMILEDDVKIGKPGSACENGRNAGSLCRASR
ncbi:unnamed protein product [Caenorhabditis sp. 36 PRJEB53466]|nr:unnamed protein product [Caenorhabditis sp. 36 PRJEB53466]